MLQALEDRCQVDSIYTDFSKAFDTVSHNILLKKLEAWGIRDNVLSWFRTYLTGRKQNVRIKGFSSQDIMATSGVPQGSHLGPYLFNLFINDLTREIQSEHLLYADDLKLFRIVKSHEDCVLLQDDLDRIKAWCSLNKLELNIEKCKSISFWKTTHLIENDYVVEGTVLERVSSISDLGIIIDNKMTFQPHYDYIINKSLKLLGFVNRCSQGFSDIRCLNFLYNALVRSRLEYLCCVWSPSYMVHVSNIETVQNKYIKIASFKTKFPLTYYNYNEARIRFGLERLECRRVKADVIFLFKLVNNLIDCPELLSQVGLRAPARQTRSTELFALKFHRCNYGVFSPISRIAANGNKVNLDFFSYSLGSFKRRIAEMRFNGP